MSGGKVPASPPTALTLDPALHLRAYDGVLWRIFSTAGDHPTEWNELRHFGPIPGKRFDPHPLPEQEHLGVGVMYTSTTPNTAFGEVYQEFRVIDRDFNEPAIAAWRPSRELQLLDLTTNWPVKNGSSAAMMMDDKTNTSTWARAIFEQFGDQVDGLYHHSSITNEPMVTLFIRTKVLDAFPQRPGLRILLDDAAADVLILDAMEFLDYRVSRI